MTTVAHPLFARPWHELRWMMWIAYLFGPIVVTALSSPVLDLLAPANLRDELVRNSIGCVLGVAAIHALYATVVPRLVREPIPVRRLPLVHAAILAVALLVAAEAFRVMLPASLDNLGPTESRLKYLQFGVVYGGALVLALALYDRLRHEVAEGRAGERVARQQARRAQLEALQVRTDPHFLFNALNSIACLVQLDPAKAIEGIERMSDLFRLTLELSGKPAVPLSQELEVVRRYLDVEALRYDQLKYSLEVDVDAEVIEVPPLSLQPIVENAVKHGVALRDDAGPIRIGVSEAGGRLRVEVDNDEPEPSTARHAGSGRSLSILAERLRLAYGAAARLHHGRQGQRYVTSFEFPMHRTAR